MQTRQGAKVAGQTMKQLYGEDYFARIGKIGGSTKGNASHLKGFGTNRKLASEVGRIGGRKSRRPSKISVKKEAHETTNKAIDKRRFLSRLFRDGGADE